MNTSTLPVALRRTLFTDILATINTEESSLLKQENIFLGDIPNTPRAATENAFFQTVFGL
jgi:hypothetical protein